MTDKRIEGGVWWGDLLPAPGGPQAGDRMIIDRMDGTGIPYYATLGDASAAKAPSTGLILAARDDGSVVWDPPSANNGEPDTGTYATSANLLTANNGVSFIDAKSVLIVLDVEPDHYALTHFSSGRNELFSYGSSVNTASTGKGVRVCIDRSGQIHLQLSGASNSVLGARFIGSRRPQGRRHYVILWDRTASSAGVLRMWIDGTREGIPAVTMVTDPGAIVLANDSTASKLTLGCAPSSASAVPARITNAAFYEAQFWTRTTLPAELDALAWELYSNRNVLPTALKVGVTADPDSWPDLKAWYRFNDAWDTTTFQTAILDRADPAGGGPIVGPLTVVDNGRVARSFDDAFTSRTELFAPIIPSAETTELTQSAAAARSGPRGYIGHMVAAGKVTTSTSINTVKPSVKAAPHWRGRRQVTRGWYKIKSGFRGTGWMINAQWKTYGHHNQFVTTNPATGASGNNPKLQWGFKYMDAARGALASGEVSEPGSPLQVTLTMREGRLDPWPTEEVFDRYTRFNTLGLPALEVPRDTWVRITCEVYADPVNGYVKMWQAVDGVYDDTLIIDTGPANTWNQFIEFADILPGAVKNQPELADDVSLWWCGSRYMEHQPFQIYTSGNTFNVSHNTIGPIEDQILHFADFEMWTEPL